MDKKSVNSMINALQVVRIIADVKPHILKSMPLLEKLLEMSRKSDNSKICACFYDEADINGLKMKPLLGHRSVSWILEVMMFLEDANGKDVRI